MATGKLPSTDGVASGSGAVVVALGLVAPQPPPASRRRDPTTSAIARPMAAGGFETRPDSYAAMSETRPRATRITLGPAFLDRTTQHRPARWHHRAGWVSCAASRMWSSRLGTSRRRRMDGGARARAGVRGRGLRRVHGRRRGDWPVLGAVGRPPARLLGGRRRSRRPIEHSLRPARSRWARSPTARSPRSARTVTRRQGSSTSRVGVSVCSGPQTAISSACTKSFPWPDSPERAGMAHMGLSSASRPDRAPSTSKSAQSWRPLTRMGSLAGGYDAAGLGNGGRGRG